MRLAMEKIESFDVPSFHRTPMIPESPGKAPPHPPPGLVPPSLPLLHGFCDPYLMYR